MLSLASWCLLLLLNLFWKQITIIVYLIFKAFYFYRVAAAVLDGTPHGHRGVGRWKLSWITELTVVTPLEHKITPALATQTRRRRRLLHQRAVAFNHWCWWCRRKSEGVLKVSLWIDFGCWLGLSDHSSPWTWILPLADIFKNKTEQDTSSDCWRVKHSFFCEGTEQFVSKHFC